MTDVDMTAYARLHETHPQLFWRPYADSLPLNTLTTLRFRTSKEAQKAGYVCVRPHPEGTKTTPGLWMKPEDLPKLTLMLEELKAKEQHAKLETQARARLLATKELTRCTGLKEEEVLQCLRPEEFERLLSAHKTKIGIHAELARSYPVEWQGVRMDAKGLIHREGLRFKPTGAAFGQARLLKDQAQISNILEEQWQKALRKTRRKATKWENTRPAWFSQEKLSEWAKSSAALKSVHPLDAQVRAHQAHIKSVKAHHRGYAFTLPLVRSKWLDKFWGLAEFEPARIMSLMQAWEQEVFLEKITQTLTRFTLSQDELYATSTLFSLEQRQALYERMLLASIKDASTLKKVYSPSAVLITAAAKVEQAFKAKEADWHLSEAVRLCKQDLPQSLKDFYPLARQMMRRITFIAGPTNSGKTYKALSLLAEAQSGVYLGPLRLLALEVHERLLEMGVENSMVTGELVIERTGARHRSATIEMLNLQEPVDVAVIDEIQMLEDQERGGAWAQALLGAPAHHVVLAGSLSALPLVRKLAQHTGEPLEVVMLERLSPLEVMRHPSSFANITPGTALITFSRRDVLSLAAHLRDKFQQKVAVIYGALSPDVRKEQARIFREGEADILIATDAIGMGLNLPISRIIFTTKEKFNGRERVELDATSVHQIAGRAGRFGIKAMGEVGAMDNATLKHVALHLNAPVPNIAQNIRVSLNLEVARTIAHHTANASLSKILAFFVNRLFWESWAKPAVTQDQYALAAYLDDYGLSLEDGLRLLNAPAYNKDNLNPHFHAMVRAIKTGTPTKLDLTRHEPEHLEQMEDAVKTATLYCWMYYRFPALFPNIKSTQAHLAKLNAAITKALAASQPRRCKTCSRPLPWAHQHANCDNCYHNRRQRHYYYGYT